MTDLPIRYLSVCSGIEAATQAWHPLGWKPVAFSEIEAFPSAVLAHHYPDVPNHGDMTKFREWPDAAIDLLVGGTPCQSFSVAGLRKGLDDPRGNLALVYLGLVDRYRPRWVVWENVPGVLSSSGGRDFGAFLGGLGELGYGWAYRVLDAQFVRTRRFRGAVPQRRRRVFVVGYLGDWRRAAAVLFDRESLFGNHPPRREAGQRPAPTISVRPTGGGGLGTDFDLDGGLIAMEHGQAGAEIAIGHGPTLTCNHEAPIVAHSLRAEGFDASEDDTGRGAPIIPVAMGFDLAQITSATNRSRVGYELPASTLSKGGDMCVAVQEQPSAFAFDCLAGGNTAPTLRAMGHAGSHANAGGRAQERMIALPWAVRRLTPMECERLQGFPDDYTMVPWRGRNGAPDGPRYKALGNSMAVNAMEWLGERIAEVDQLGGHAAASIQLRSGG